MTAPANGLAPVTFIAKTPEELIIKIKAATKHIDYDAVEVAYHEAQIEACKRTILGHEERVSVLKGDKQEKEEEKKDDGKTDS
jgi:hypothetical protein